METEFDISLPFPMLLCTLSITTVIQRFSSGFKETSNNIAGAISYL